MHNRSTFLSKGSIWMQIFLQKKSLKPNMVSGNCKVLAAMDLESGSLIQNF